MARRRQLDGEVAGHRVGDVGAVDEQDGLAGPGPVEADSSLRIANHAGEHGKGVLELVGGEGEKIELLDRERLGRRGLELLDDGRFAADLDGLGVSLQRERKVEARFAASAHDDVRLFLILVPGVYREELIDSGGKSIENEFAVRSGHRARRFIPAARGREDQNHIRYRVAGGSPDVPR